MDAHVQLLRRLRYFAAVLNLGLKSMICNVNEPLPARWSTHKIYPWPNKRAKEIFNKVALFTTTGIKKSFLN